MRYFDNGDAVFAYEDAQTTLIAAAIANGWTELAQAPTPPTVTVTRFSSLTFFDRFTEAEQTAIATATLTSIPIKLYYDRLLGADFVDVTDARTISGVDTLIALGFVASNRKPTILATA